MELFLFPECDIQFISLEMTLFGFRSSSEASEMKTECSINMHVLHLMVSRKREIDAEMKFTMQIRRIT